MPGPYETMQESLDSRQEEVEAARLLAVKYRTVFGNPLGQEVLGHILLDILGLFDHINDQDGMARHNAAVRLLAVMGALETDPRPKIVRALLLSGAESI